MAQTLFWYDLETFGRHPQADRIAQFAGIRTNDDFEPLGEPIILYNAISPDYLPDPYACIITGITPQLTQEEGLNEYEFIQQIRKEMLVPGTTVLGYNSIKFDDEFIRNTLYRNFYDPYEREWSGGNSRWDVIDLVRATHDLRPQGISWPTDETGKPSFKLEKLTEANGIGHEHAHDALSDVWATIALAKLIREKQPKLFSFYFNHRKKEAQRRLVDLGRMTPLLHTSGTYTSSRGCTTLIAPLGIDPQIRNNLIALDLRYDPTPLIELGVEEIKRRIFSSKKELEAEFELTKTFRIDQGDPRLNQENFGGRIPLVTIGLNRCPFLAPLATLDGDAAEKIGLDVAKCLEHHRILTNHPQLIQKITAVFSRDDTPKAETKDPDFLIYTGGFFKDEDKDQFVTIHGELESKTPEEARSNLYNLQFQDTRLPQMIRRFFARNYPHTLTPKELERWKSFCAGRILYPPTNQGTDLATYTKILITKMESSDTPARDKVILKAMLDYKKSLESQILTYRPKGSPETEL